MSFFNKPSKQKETGKIPERSAESPEPDGGIPVSVIDLSKRYDIYCYLPGEYRLYENVRVLGIKSFEATKHKFGTSVIGGYIEIEAENGVRMMIQSVRINMICEHGSEPIYKVLRGRQSGDDDCA
jgi:hypothetical protein